MAADAAGKGELLEKLAHAVLVLALVWVDLRIGALQVSWSQDAGRAVARSSHEDRVEIVLFDQAIQMDVNEAQAGTRSPVAQQALFDVLPCQGFAQQRVGTEIDHPRGQVFAGPPVGICFVQFVVGQRRRSRQVCVPRHVSLPIFYHRCSISHERSFFVGRPWSSTWSSGFERFQLVFLMASWGNSPLVSERSKSLVSRTMVKSSLVEMTRMRPGEVGEATSASGLHLAFALTSSFKPKCPKFSQASSLTCAEFSPTPAVKTKASTPSRVAAMAPMVCTRRWM